MTGAMKTDNDIHIGPTYQLGINSEAVRNFYKKNWNRRIALSLKSFYNWQFVQPPENDSQDWNCVAVRRATILGVMGVNRRTFYLERKPLKGAELTTWVVSETARGLGVG